jgi:hypothetical protein
MLKYDDLINTIIEIVNNDKIYKPGLTITYVLDEINHKKLDEHIYYVNNPNGDNYQYNDITIVEVNDIIIKLIKKIENENSK